MSPALPRLIGITGRAGAGKDTLADHLVSTYGFTKYGFSFPIKQLLNERFGWTDANWLDREWKERRHRDFGHSAHAGCMDENFTAFSPRSWAQWLGTEVGRAIGGEETWVNMMEREWFFLNRHADIAPAMVIPDVRFPNEAQRIYQLGGVVIRVLRPDAAPVLDHASERDLPDQLVSVQVHNTRDINTFLIGCITALEECPRGV